MVVKKDDKRNVDDKDTKRRYVCVSACVCICVLQRRNGFKLTC